MPYYSQKNYNQELGTGQYTIAQAGSLLTAFCNLLPRFGVSITPPQLDDYFRAASSTLRPYEDLSWSSISVVDKLIGVQQVGSASLPPTADAIVKFHHQSIQTPVVVVNGQEVPNMVDHFCAVDRISGGQLFIIDSWDGSIKGQNTYERIYGRPLAWATYQKHVPVPAVEGLKHPAGAAAAPPKVTYNVITEVPGYNTALQALSHGQTSTRVRPRKYYIWDKDKSGMVNVGETYGLPGYWINPSDNTYKLPSKVSPVNSPQTYTVVRQLDGYDSSTGALDHEYSAYRINPGSYYLTKEQDGMLALSTEVGKISAWINPEDNVMVKTKLTDPAPVPAHAATPQTTVTETEQSTASDWRGSYKPFPTQPSNFYATKTFTVHDLEGKYPDTTCHKFDLCPLAGTFIGSDGVLYGRTMRSTFPNQRKTERAQALPPFWYGLPMKLLMSEDEVWSTQTDIMTRYATNNLKTRDHLAIAIGKFSGWLERIGKKKDVTRK